MHPIADLFRLFGRLTADGLTPGTWQALAVVAELADIVGPLPAPDDAAADHQDLLRYRVLPYASLFLDGTHRVGGPATDAVARFYRSFGITPTRTDLADDHLATEIQVLAACLEGGQEGAARRFIDGHLLVWLPAVVRAIRNQPFPVYSQLSEVLLEMVLELRGHLGAPYQEENEITLATPAPLLSDPASGVREIAAWLTTPAYSGFFVGRGDVVRLARAAEAPRGMGGAALMMENALRSAAMYDGLGTFVDGLDSMAVSARRDWKAVAERWPTGWPAHWIERIDGTREILGEVIQRVSTVE